MVKICRLMGAGQASRSSTPINRTVQISSRPFYLFFIRSRIICAPIKLVILSKTFFRINTRPNQRPRFQIWTAIFGPLECIKYRCFSVTE